MKHRIVTCLVLCGCALLSISASGDHAPGKEKVFRAVVDPDGVQRAEIVGGSYFFSPDRVVVRVNIPVDLKVRKEPGIVPHDIVIKAPEAGIDFEESLSSDPKVIRFTPTRTGAYPFYCGKKLLFFESHRDKGMAGVLEVVE